MINEVNNTKGSIVVKKGLITNGTTIFHSRSSMASI